MIAGGLAAEASPDASLLLTVHTLGLPLSGTTTTLPLPGTNSKMYSPFLMASSTQTVALCSDDLANRERGSLPWPQRIAPSSRG